MSQSSVSTRSYPFILIMLALGYMVDFYDLTIFAAARVPILQHLGVPPEQYMETSAFLFNIQALGILVGGLTFGVWGDKIGRMSSIRMGIFIYSVATLLNVYTQTVNSFATVRFFAGVGLAAELGASITLLSEITSAKKRSLASGMVYFFGVVGGILATFIGSAFSWQTMFVVGGVAGLLLLIFRFAYADSVIFNNLKEQTQVVRGSLAHLFFKTNSLKRILFLTLGVVPFWFMAFFVNFAPEIARSVGLPEEPNQSYALALYFVGSLFGTFAFPLIAIKISSAKKSIFLAFILMLVALSIFTAGPLLSIEAFYAVLFLMGFACGYPGIFMTFIAESFGTNQRATACSFVSCFARSSLIFINILVPFLSNLFQSMLWGACVAALFIFTIASLPLLGMKETHQKEINFTE